MKVSCIRLTLRPSCLFSQQSQARVCARPLSSMPPWSGDRLGNHQALGDWGGPCGPQVLLCRKSALHLVNWELRVVWESSKSFYCPFFFFLTGFNPDGQLHTHPGRPHYLLSPKSDTEHSLSKTRRGTHGVSPPQRS